MDVYVKIKDEKHAEKVIKRLVRVGYKEFGSTIPLDEVVSIDVFDDGDYQLLNFEELATIKPKDVMSSAPVKYFLEHNHV